MKTEIRRIHSSHIADYAAFLAICLRDRVFVGRTCLRTLLPMQVQTLLSHLFSADAQYYLVLTGRARGRYPTAFLILDPQPWDTVQIYYFSHPRRRRQTFWSDLWPQVTAAAVEMGAFRLEIEVSSAHESFLEALKARQSETGLRLEGIRRLAVLDADGNRRDLYLFGKVLGDHGG